ncbi:MAG: 4Fe-4S binding protein [Desulfatiglandaceae bacterium]|jgi:polyferredoxin/formate hydrogenlyase subunit 6/NADH:ubiquinone oxidoreductase subunit I
MKARNLVRIRRISQAFFLLLFLFLLVESRLPQEAYQQYSEVFSTGENLGLDRPVRFFFQLDPLVVVTSLFSGHHLIRGFFWGVLILLVTLLFGRLFCGFICPFGTIHHLVGSLRPSLRSARRIQASQKSPGQRIKYFLLFTLLVSAVLGLNLSGLLDPISFLFRSIALALLPGVGVALNSLFHALADSHTKILNLLSYGAEILMAPVFGYEPQVYRMAWFMGLLFLVLLFLNRIRPRFWCRFLCPLGALLGLCSRMSLLRLEKDGEKCTDCKRCTSICQGAASPEPGLTWQSGECITCFNCIAVCPEDALAFRVGWFFGGNKGPDMGRRAVLGGLIAGVSIPFLGKLDGRAAKTTDARLIRPPGSLEEEAFLTLCQRCGLCMKVCPTNVINPTLGEAGMAGFWSPRLIMAMGYCEYTCTLCSSECPTGAIRTISVREKIGKPIRIGSAYVDRGRCLPWSGNAPCIVCEEHCPTSPKAIYLKKDRSRSREGKQTEFQVPLVDLKQCVGCGICENKCPVRGRPAIRVIAAGESRSLRNRILL